MLVVIETLGVARRALDGHGRRQATAPATRRASFAVVLLFLLGACAPAPAGPLGATVPGSAPIPPRKRITAAMQSNPPSISSTFVGAGSGTLQGGDALEDLVNAGMSIVDSQGRLIPQLAETVPSIDNGLWRVLPDGRTETTWRIRDGAVWHDGVVFSADDLLFTIKLGVDKDLAFFQNGGAELVEAAEVMDGRDLTIRWKKPYMQADRMFTRRLALPRPQHVLGPVYAENKEALAQHPYWTEAYVGTGAFRLKRFAPGSFLLLEANDRFVLGRPRVDEVEVRFIPDSSTLAANILAGEVELTLGRNLSLTQALQIRDQWKDGTINVGIKNWFAVWPQLLNPGQPLLLDVQFRRALLHAIDRQQLVETMQQGLVPVAHSFVSPTDPVHREIEPSIVKYDFDVRRTAQILEGLGYPKSGDGVHRNASGQSVALEVRTDGGGGDDAQETAALAVADAFKQAGLAAEPQILGQLQRQNREFNSTYPGVRVWRLPNDIWSVDRYHSAAAPLPENRFNGGNRSRYINPSFDAIVERYMSTISERDRAPILAQIVHHMTDQLTVMGLWYNTEPVMISKRLLGVTARDVGETTEAWNAHLWDVSRP